MTMTDDDDTKLKTIDVEELDDVEEGYEPEEVRAQIRAASAEEKWGMPSEKNILKVLILPRSLNLIS